MTEHKELCLKINGKQNVKLRNRSIKFENYFIQLAVSFKIYIDFECNVKKVKNCDKSSHRGDNGSWLIQKVIKKHFNKNLAMSAEEEERFELSNKCWICDKLFDVGDDKVRDYCHVTEKYPGSAHRSCNVDEKSSCNVS